MAGNGGGAGLEAGRVFPERVWPAVLMVGVRASGSCRESVDPAAARRAKRAANGSTPPALGAPGQPAPLPAALPPQPQAGRAARCLHRAGEYGMMRASPGARTPRPGGGG